MMEKLVHILCSYPPVSLYRRASVSRISPLALATSRSQHTCEVHHVFRIKFFIHYTVSNKAFFEWPDQVVVALPETALALVYKKKIRHKIPNYRHRPACE